MPETEELARKKKVHGGQASATRVMGQAHSFTTSDHLDVSKIIQLKQSLEDKLQSLSTLDEEILMLTPEEVIEDEIIQADEIKERVYTALSMLELALKPVSAAIICTDPLPVDPPATVPPTITSDPATLEPRLLSEEPK